MSDAHKHSPKLTVHANDGSLRTDIDLTAACQAGGELGYRRWLSNLSAALKPIPTAENKLKNHQLHHTRMPSATAGQLDSKSP
jgi:hypothetical protein